MSKVMFDTLASVQQAQGNYKSNNGGGLGPGKFNLPFSTSGIKLVSAVLSLIGASVLIAYAIATLGFQTGIAIILVILGIPILTACLFNPFFGLSILLLVSFFIMGAKKFIPGEPPLGIILDIFTLFLFIGIFIKQSYYRDFSVLKHPISLVVLAWIVFNMLQVLNPWADSQLAWFYTVRGMAGLTLLYFVSLYAFKDLQSIRIVSALLIGLGFLAGLYGLYQEFFGFNAVEWNWLNANEQRYELIFQWGRYRKFSFLSDPTTDRKSVV